MSNTNCSCRRWTGCGWFLFFFFLPESQRLKGFALIKGTSLTYPDTLDLSDQAQCHRSDMRAGPKHRPVAPLVNGFNMATFCCIQVTQKLKFSSFTLSHIVIKPYVFIPAVEHKSRKVEEYTGCSKQINKQINKKHNKIALWSQI